MRTDTSALRAVDKLIKSAPTDADQRAAKRMRARMLKRMNAMPMSEIINRMPDGSIPSKARMLGVSRQTMHYWIEGRMRPRWPMAKKLEKLTGISAEVIRGDDPA